MVIHRVRPAKRPAAVILLTALRAVLVVLVAHTAMHGAPAEQLIENGGYVVTRNGSPIVAYHSETPFIPASTLKIATAYTALELLGPSYRFKTEFYLRDGDLLCIKGYGDPYLLSEDIAAIAGALRDTGLQRVRGLILDDTFFAAHAPADGSGTSVNPYDAANAALAVNFNALPLIKYDTGAVASPEPQTPLLPIALDIARHLQPGRHHVNVTSFSAADRSITHHRYVAELFAELLRQRGIAVDPVFETGRVRASDTLLHTHASRLPLAEMIRGCLKFSSNFIANQLFLTSGAARFGQPATWEKARETARLALTDGTGIEPAEFTIVEGSGLSTQNRMTPAAMIALLEAFKPYAHLLSRTRGIALKSGTLTGVYGYAGYFEAAATLDPFVLLLNQRSNTRDPLLARLSDIHRRASHRSSPGPAGAPR